MKSERQRANKKRLSSSAFRPSSANAPAKLILCGEHAVVYGRPAIALPLSDVRAHASVTAGRQGVGIRIAAPDLQRSWTVRERPDNPLSELALATLRHLRVAPLDLTVTLTSTIPIASGMGSGAAIATALVRALAASLGHTLAPDAISKLVYASEQRFHGTPSGIDNTVIAFEQPIWFVRGGTEDGGRKTEDEEERDSSSVPRPSPPTLEPLSIASPLTVVIGDTGVRSPTRLPVGEVRQRWQADPARYEALFDQIGGVVMQARVALEKGTLIALGAILDANQELLEQIGVSSPELERLIAAARSAGALGAKLSGAGWGGVMLALVDETNRAAVAQSLREAGAVRVLETTVVAESRADEAEARLRDLEAELRRLRGEA